MIVWQFKLRAFPLLEEASPSLLSSTLTEGDSSPFLHRGYLSSRLTFHESILTTILWIRQGWGHPSSHLLKLGHWALRNGGVTGPEVQWAQAAQLRREPLVLALFSGFCSHFIHWQCNTNCINYIENGGWRYRVGAPPPIVSVSSSHSSRFFSASRSRNVCKFYQLPRWYWLTIEPGWRKTWRWLSGSFLSMHSRPSLVTHGSFQVKKERESERENLGILAGCRCCGWRVKFRISFSDIGT